MNRYPGIGDIALVHMTSNKKKLFEIYLNEGICLFDQKTVILLDRELKNMNMKTILEQCKRIYGNYNYE